MTCLCCLNTSHLLDLVAQAVEPSFCSFVCIDIETTGHLAGLLVGVSNISLLSGDVKIFVEIFAHLL